MDFNNFNGYITLTNEEMPPINFKHFKVNRSEFQINIPIEDFNFQNISDFFIESECSFLENCKTNKGKNIKHQKLLGFITNIKINLKEVLEYSLDNSEIKVFFYEDFIGDSILTPNYIDSNIKPYFYLNFMHMYRENAENLNISLIYTIYLN